MRKRLDVSVIIPTYNRKDSLLRTLDSLSRQTFPADRFEVIVMDDGSTDGTEEIAEETFPFILRYVYQTNSGGVVARNRGASEAQGDLLVFLDDDMSPLADYIVSLAKAHGDAKALILRGQLTPWSKADSMFARVQYAEQKEPCVGIGCFASNNLALRREAFFDLGGFRDVVPDDAEHKGGLWADLEFAYRALQAGFRFRTVSGAKVIHRDYAVQSLGVAAKRAQMVSRLAIPVLRRYPELFQYAPMFHDKTPIAWGQDPPRLVARKLARHVASSRPALWGLEQLVHALEQRHPSPALLRPLYRWVIGGYIFQGYREGLREVVGHR